MESDKIFLFLVLAAAGIIVRLAVGSWNHSRIRDHFTALGCTDIHIEWDPFGPGWFGEKDSIIYRITYTDREGCARCEHCKIGIFSGMYFTPGDTGSPGIAFRSQLPEKPAAAALRRTEPLAERPYAASGFPDLARENARLTEENARLRKELEELRQGRLPQQ